MQDKSFLKKIKSLLLSQRNEILNVSKTSSDIDTDGDETDEIQANLIMELNSQLTHRNYEKLRKINEALKKIEDKIYGDCEDCGESISEKRLLLRPYSPTCIFCAEERELLDKQRKRV